MRPRTALTIAGSDSGGGAGIQADLKTFLDHGVYGMSVVCALTAQNTRAVTGVWGVDPAFVVRQLEAVFDDLPVDAVKIGMLGTAAVTRAVAGFLRGRDVPIVLDPVMVAKSGDTLLDADAVAALREELLPLATLVTPNLPEAGVLGKFSDPAILLKDGHGTGEDVVDVLIRGQHRREFRHPRVPSRHTHGTGCTLSAAIAARLARGEGLEAACGGAIAYVSALIVGSAGGLGGGNGPLFHGLLDRLPRA